MTFFLLTSYREYRCFEKVEKLWLSVDPLAEKYPAHSPYCYTMNNPVMLVDPDGREWDIKKSSSGTKISVAVNFDVDAKSSQKQIETYKQAINKQFDETLRTSSNDAYSGEVTFDGGKNENQVTPNLSFYEAEAGSVIGGVASAGSACVNLMDKEGNLRSPSDVANDAVHELFHTVRLSHPFERTQSGDTELVHVSGNDYKSTQQTDLNILYNIMNYNSTRIDGKSANGNQTLLTLGQINLIQKEVGLQKQGYGMMPKYNSAVSRKVNEVEYIKKYLNYWGEFPGKDVPRSK